MAHAERSVPGSECMMNLNQSLQFLSGRIDNAYAESRYDVPMRSREMWHRVCQIKAANGIGSALSRLRTLSLDGSCAVKPAYLFCRLL